MSKGSAVTALAVAFTVAGLAIAATLAGGSVATGRVSNAVALAKFLKSRTHIPSVLPRKSVLDNYSLEATAGPSHYEISFVNCVEKFPLNSSKTGSCAGESSVSDLIAYFAATKYASKTAAFEARAGVFEFGSNDPGPGVCSGRSLDSVSEAMDGRRVYLCGSKVSGSIVPAIASWQMDHLQVTEIIDQTSIEGWRAQVDAAVVHVDALCLGRHLGTLEIAPLGEGNASVAVWVSGQILYSIGTSRLDLAARFTCALTM